MKTTSIILSAPVSQKYEATRFAHNPQPSVVVAPLTLTLPKNTKTASVSNLLAASILSAPKETTLPPRYDVRDKLTGSLTTVLNQGHCGSCWAFSSATASSDVFTLAQQKIKGKDTERVDISPMSFMYISGTLSTNQGCLGGNPLSTVKFILENERVLVTNGCSDYSWYVEAQASNPGDTTGLNTSWIDNVPSITNEGVTLPFMETDTEQLRCFEKPTTGEHYQFSLGESVMIPGNPNVKNTDEIVLTFPDSPPDAIYSNGKVDTNIAQLAVANQKMMMHNLIDHGSFVIGISVFDGFMSGGGELTNPEIVESLGNDINKSWVTGLPDGNVYMQDPTDLHCRGGHALTVVGYGSHKRVETAALNNMNAWYGTGAGKIIKNAIEKLGGNVGSYWIVRNSWGTNWPHSDLVENNPKLQGYFCLAFYPANMLVQLAHPFHMASPVQSTPAIGGNSSLYSKLMQNNNNKFGLFSMFVGMSAGDVCSDDCDTALKTLPSSIRDPFFSKLSKIKNGSKTSLLAATKTTVGQLSEWSGYLSNNPTFYTKPSETYTTGSHGRGPSPGPSPVSGKSPSHTGVSTTVIVIIIASAFLLLAIVAFWLIRRGRRKGRK